MFDQKYMDCLKEFVGRDVPLIYRKDGSIVFFDNDQEVKFFFREEPDRYVLYVQNRGNLSIDSVFKKNDDFPYGFAVVAYRLYGPGDGPSYDCPQSVLIAGTDFRLQMSIGRYFDHRLFSICSLIGEKKNRINLKSLPNDKYELFYLHEDGRRVNLEPDLIWDKEETKTRSYYYKRFYFEISHFAYELDLMDHLQKAFRIRLTYTQCLDILGFFDTDTE